MTPSPTESADLDLLTEQIEQDLLPALHIQAARFPSVERLVERYEGALQRLLEKGWDFLEAFEEAHNELCAAALILDDPAEPICERLEYEPTIRGCDKRFDFRAEFTGLEPKWIEVKTIHPRLLDGWEKYEAAVEAGRFPTNARLVLSKEWLGGELFHKSYAARAKMLAYTIETENKISACLDVERGPVFLVLFSNGFDWHMDELEDFLHFYRLGHHSDSDHFRLMEEYYIEANGVTLRRSIDHFAWVKRPSHEVRPVGAVWSVKPVQFSPDRGFCINP